MTRQVKERSEEEVRKIAQNDGGKGLNQIYQHLKFETGLMGMVAGASRSCRRRSVALLLTF